MAPRNQGEEPLEALFTLVCQRSASAGMHGRAAKLASIDDPTLRVLAMDVEFGNVGSVNTNGTGWIVAFSDWAKNGQANLRYMNKHALSHALCVKWFDHPKDDPGGTGKPVSEGRSISFLVSGSGKFRIDFSEDKNFPADRTVTYILEKRGDFVIWGEGVHHCWFADEASSILTVRWIPIQPANA